MLEIISLKSRKFFKKYLLFIIVLVIGTILRLYLASKEYNFDIENFIKTTELVLNGKNVYEFQKFYNYSPLYAYILGGIGLLQKHILPFISLPFLIRAFLTFIDLITLIPLIKISKLTNRSSIVAVAAFYLNPVSIIITGKHGQFDNIAIFLLLCATYLLLKNNTLLKSTKLTIWSLLTFTILIKHIVIFQVVLLIGRISKFKHKLFILLMFTILIFVLSFVPFWDKGSMNIIYSVVKYGGIAGSYGVTFILNKLCDQCIFGTVSLIYLYKYIFIISSTLFTLFLILKRKAIVYSILISILFFMTFTSGIGAQYFVLPIAYGALRSNIFLLFYSLVTFLFLLGSKYEFNFQPLQIINWNSVWIVAIIWFCFELKYLFRKNEEK